MIVQLIIWLVLGFLAGYIAKMNMPRAYGGGLALTTLLGIGGAVGGGVIGIGYYGYPMISSFNNIGYSIPSFISSILGAIVVLAIFRLLKGRRV